LVERREEGTPRVEGTVAKKKKKKMRRKRRRRENPEDEGKRGRADG